MWQWHKICNLDRGMSKHESGVCFVSKSSWIQSIKAMFPIQTIPISFISLFKSLISKFNQTYSPNLMMPPMTILFVLMILIIWLPDHIKPATTSAIDVLVSTRIHKLPVNRKYHQMTMPLSSYRKIWGTTNLLTFYTRILQLILCRHTNVTFHSPSHP